MALDAESIWEAVAARLKDRTSSFVTVTRKRRVNFAPEELPALMVLDDDGDETLIGEPDDPAPAWKLTGEIIVLIRAEAEADRPASMLNALVREIREALERQVTDPAGDRWGFYTDLDGAVQSLAVTRVEKSGAPLVGFPVAKVSLEIETEPA